MKETHAGIYKKVTSYGGINLYLSTNHDEGNSYHSLNANFALATILRTKTQLFHISPTGEKLKLGMNN